LNSTVFDVTVSLYDRAKSLNDDPEAGYIFPDNMTNSFTSSSGNGDFSYVYPGGEDGIF